MLWVAFRVCVCVCGLSLPTPPHLFLFLLPLIALLVFCLFSHPLSLSLFHPPSSVLSFFLSLPPVLLLPFSATYAKQILSLPSPTHHSHFFLPRTDRKVLCFLVLLPSLQINQYTNSLSSLLSPPPPPPLSSLYSVCLTKCISLLPSTHPPNHPPARSVRDRR